MGQICEDLSLKMNHLMLTKSEDDDELMSFKDFKFAQGWGDASKFKMRRNTQGKNENG